jgi:hypothetical protein
MGEPPGRAPVACKVERDGTVSVIEYKFTNGALYSQSSDSVLEYRKERGVLGARSLRAPEAAALLRSMAKDSYGEDECGMDWANPRRTPESIEFSGSTCNCRGTLELKAGQVVAIEIHTAC